MTTANGPSAPPRRRPSAASRSAVARGALPLAPSTCGAAPAVRWQRAGGIAILLAGLAATTAAPSPGLAAGGAEAREAQQARTAAAPGRRTVRTLRTPAAGPRLPDAPMELLPAAETRPAFPATSPRAACLAAARRAEAVHGLPEGLMVAIALSESGLHAHALNIRGRAHFPEDAETARALLARAGGRAMAGCVQVNAGVHARGEDWPLDAERATDWAAGLLRRWYVETGSWTAALARWHGGSPAGTRRVLCRVRAKLEVTAPGSSVLQDAPCGGGGDTARLRRNGATLLEIAEAQ